MGKQLLGWATLLVSLEADIKANPKPSSQTQLLLVNDLRFDAV